MVVKWKRLIVCSSGFFSINGQPCNSLPLSAQSCFMYLFPVQVHQRQEENSSANDRPVESLRSALIMLCVSEFILLVSDGVCCASGQGGPYSPEGAALGGYGLDRQAHLGLRTAGKDLSTNHLKQYKWNVLRLHCCLNTMKSHRVR